MSNPTLANDQPSTPGAASDKPDASKAFPTGSTVEPAYDNTSSVPAPAASDDESTGSRPWFAEPALGDSNAENLKGGVVGKEYSETTLQGAHFPTSSTTDDHPGGGEKSGSSGAQRASDVSSSSLESEFTEPALGDSNAENLRGGVVGKEYSKTTLQGANFPTSDPTDDHPGGSDDA